MAGVGRIVWRPGLFLRRLDQMVSRNLDRAAMFLSADIKKAFPGSGIGGTRAGATKGEREAHRSRPYEIPHVQTGTLKRSVTWATVSSWIRYIGSTLKPQGGKGSHSYPLYLEYGTSKMLPRPWLRPALDRNRPKLLAIIRGKA